MNIGIIFLTAVANILLQIMSRNIIYAYVFLIYTLGAMAIDLYDKKYGKIFMAAIFLAYTLLFVNCIYNHIIYEVILLDYIFVSIETVIVAILTAIAILPIKEKVSRASGRLFLHRVMRRFLYLFGEEPNEKIFIKKVVFLRHYRFFA